MNNKNVWLKDEKIGEKISKLRLDYVTETNDDNVTDSKAIMWVIDKYLENER